MKDTLHCVQLWAMVGGKRVGGGRSARASKWSRYGCICISTSWPATIQSLTKDALQNRMARRPMFIKSFTGKHINRLCASSVDKHRKDVSSVGSTIHRYLLYPSLPLNVRNSVDFIQTISPSLCSANRNLKLLGNKQMLCILRTRIQYNFNKKIEYFHTTGLLEMQPKLIIFCVYFTRPKYTAAPFHHSLQRHVGRQTDL